MIKTVTLKVITLEELRSRDSTNPQNKSSFQTFQKRGKKILTLNGCYINFHNTFFFTDKDILKRHPWKVTINKGLLPCAQEWNRLQREYGLIPIDLTEEEEKKASLIAQQINGDPMSWLTQQEVAGYLKRSIGQNVRIKKEKV